MIRFLLSLFHRRRRWQHYRADYDTGEAPIYYGPINWEALRNRKP